MSSKYTKSLALLLDNALLLLLILLLTLLADRDVVSLTLLLLFPMLLLLPRLLLVPMLLWEGRKEVERLIWGGMSLLTREALLRNSVVRKDNTFKIQNKQTSFQTI